MLELAVADGKVDPKGGRRQSNVGAMCVHQL